MKNRVNTDVASSARLYEDNEYPHPKIDSAIKQNTIICYPGEGKAFAGIFYDHAPNRFL